MVASNRVWIEISDELDNRMTGKAIRTLVFEGRYSIKDKLGFTSISKPINETNVPNQVLVSGKLIMTNAYS